MGTGDLLGIVQEIKIWLYYQMEHAQIRICLGEWDAQNSLGLWDISRYSNVWQNTQPADKYKKKSL